MSQSRLGLAAFLGHEAALVATAQEQRLLSSVSQLIEEIADTEAQIRAALAAISLAWKSFEEIWRLYPTGWEAFLARLAAVEEWVLDPSDRARRVVEGVMSRRVFIGLEHVLLGAGRVDDCLVELAKGVAMGWSEERARASLTLAEFGFSAAQFEAQVRVPVCAELVPWALGYRDPVRERVEARRRSEAGQ